MCSVVYEETKSYGQIGDNTIDAKVNVVNCGDYIVVESTSYCCHYYGHTSEDWDYDPLWRLEDALLVEYNRYSHSVLMRKCIAWSDAWFERVGRYADSEYKNNR